MAEWGRVIHWKSSKWLNVDDTTNSYWHESESVLEDEKPTILLDFDSQTVTKSSSENHAYSS